ncbi:MAG: MinD/ParA family protein [bacterium]|nr:MinD/ParA family protein [bacterium]
MLDQAEKLRKIAKENNKNNGLTRVITVTSGKGGVGKTNLSVNLAISYAKMGKRVVVFDADLGLSNVNVALGLIPGPKYNLYHVLKGQKNILDVATDAPGGIKIISGAIGIVELSNLSEEQRKNFVEGIGKLSEIAEIIIIDTGAGLSANVLSFILAADEVVLITTPEPTAIADAYGMMKAIYKEDDEKNVKLVINRVDSIMEGKKIVDHFTNIVGQFLNMKVESLGYILEDAIVGKAIRQRRPFALNYPNSKATNCVHHIRNKLENVSEEPKGITNFIKSFFRYSVNL